MVDKDSHSTNLCLGWRRSFNIFIQLTTLFGFYLGQSYLTTLVTLQNCTKCLEILLLLYKLHILASNQKKFLFFFEQLLSNFRYKKQLLFVFWKTFWEVTGNFLKNLEQLVESLTTYDSLRLTMAQKFVIVTSYQRRRRQRQRHKSNRFN